MVCLISVRLDPGPDQRVRTSCGPGSGAGGVAGRLVSVVSNNAGAAIEAYLAEHGLGGYVAGVFGRIPGDPSSMKPNPHLLLEAMEGAGAGPEHCIFIGDAACDVEAGKALAFPRSAMPTGRGRTPSRPPPGPWRSWTQWRWSPRAFSAFRPVQTSNDRGRTVARRPRHPSYLATVE
ncbi:HAD family hydrolase [Kitasatospora sp. NPDC096128]|uniref:HAD family hydrolase n=1 Tax=Kitasatospora sp. NPDC096128 TaxID=3155547 RepID=UPI003321D7B9